MADTRIENNKGLGAFIAVWALVLIAVFLAYRGDDVGKLPVLFSNLGGRPLFGKGAIDSLLGLIFSCLIILSWIGLGRTVSRFFLNNESTDRSVFLLIAFRAGLGAAIWSLMWFGLGLVGGYTSIAALFA